MPTQDTSEIREKIISILNRRGPSLPVHIAKELNLSMLFASAFLSELLSEKKIKISNMKVGNSPVYFISGQEPKLENFSQYLKSREKDAFILLKEKKFLTDQEQDPAIRVALRAIKDFAVPFKKNEEIFWRYLTIPETEIKTEEKVVPITPPEKIEPISQVKETKSLEELNIFDKTRENPPKKTKTITKKKTSNKKNEKFFNKVKEFLTEKQIEIVDIENFNKEDLILRIKENNQEKLLIAFNKKRIREEEIIKAFKKSQESNLNYVILSLGEPLRKLKCLIKALEKLEKLEKIKD
ncbi:hypothetical protein KAJ87_01730 [Candidatus Pacearchaeota archaeon]|nr:hypothetical protein [Candidatus Pacearchaeota archaeon]